MFDENSPYNPYMGYGLSKMRLEQALRERITRKQTPEITIVRAPWFYGPGQPPRQTLFFQMIRDGKMPIFGNGENRRSMAYTDSLALGLMLAAQTPAAAGELFWIADARPYPMQEIIATVADVLTKDFGKTVKRTAPHLPGIISDVARLVDKSVQALGLYHQKVHVLSEMNQTIACSIAKAERTLGYKPLVELREGMRRSIEWCLQNGHSI
jgi:nucleoside-diphosphate-sugar epimerase